MTPADFANLATTEAELDAQMQGQIRLIETHCAAVRQVLARHLPTASHDAAYARARGQLQAALDDLAEIIMRRADIREAIEAEPLARVAMQPGTRH